MKNKPKNVRHVQRTGYISENVWNEAEESTNAEKEHKDSDNVLNKAEESKNVKIEDNESEQKPERGCGVQ